MRKVFLFVPCPENYLKPWWSILTSLPKRFQIEVAEAKEVKTKQWDFDSDEEDKDDIEESGESEEEEYSDWRQITKSICCFPLGRVGPARGDCFLGIWGGVCSVRFTKPDLFTEQQFLRASFRAVLMFWWLLLQIGYLLCLVLYVSVRESWHLLQFENARMYPVLKHLNTEGLTTHGLLKRCGSSSQNLLSS